MRRQLGVQFGIQASKAVRMISFDVELYGHLRRRTCVPFVVKHRQVRMRYWLQIDGRWTGPATVANIMDRVKSGELAPTTLCGPNWKEIQGGKMNPGDFAEPLSNFLPIWEQDPDAEVVKRVGNILPANATTNTYSQQNKSYFTDTFRSLIPLAVIAATLLGFYLGFTRASFLEQAVTLGLTSLVRRVLGAGIGFVFSSVIAGHFLNHLRVKELLEEQLHYLREAEKRVTNP